MSRGFLSPKATSCKQLCKGASSSKPNSAARAKPGTCFQSLFQSCCAVSTVKMGARSRVNTSISIHLMFSTQRPWKLWLAVPNCHFPLTHPTFRCRNMVAGSHVFTFPNDATGRSGDAPSSCCCTPAKNLQRSISTV